MTWEGTSTLRKPFRTDPVALPVTPTELKGVVLTRYWRGALASTEIE
ncbi:hypothetical protein [Variovorax paradoxus]